MNNKYYKSPESNKMMRLFWKACGADAYLLEKSTYGDQIKYFCLGGIVVATGVMAALAGGYAIYTIFEPKGDALDGMFTQKAAQAGKMARDFIHIPTLIVSIVFGVIWGLIIYNIDRFIVTSTGKGDGTEAITGQEFKSAIPRIIMGMIIAMTISKPIEIRMFKSEIDAEISVIQKEYLDKLDSTTNASFNLKIAPLKFERDSLKQANETQRIEIKSQRRRLEDEAAGLLPPNPPGRGPAWQDKKETLDKMESEFKVTKASNDVEIRRLSAEIEVFEKQRRAEFKENIKKKYSKDGLLLRIQLADEIAGRTISIFITLLFMVIELTPIFFKMMLIKGPYDFMDENVKELARAEAGVEIIYNYYHSKDELNNSKSDLSSADIKKNNVGGYEVHKVINHAADLKAKERLLIIKAQEELNQQIIEKWKQKKSREIDENPDNFVSES
jgi:hypothetical protein